MAYPIKAEPDVAVRAEVELAKDGPDESDGAAVEKRTTHP